MLGWINPTVIVNDGEYTLNDFASTGDTLLIPLNFNNSYFSEYLLISLYTDNGVNEFFKDQESNYQIFDKKEYGIMIFFVSSYLVESYDDINNDYYSLTINNNSTTDTPLIYLIERDGEYSFDSSHGYTAASDLWIKGDKFSDVYEEYTRSDGKYINFDIEVIELNDGEAKIKVTFNN